MAITIDPTAEFVFPLSEAHKHLPDEPCYNTVLYWARSGIKKKGKRVKLETVKMPRGFATSVNAYNRFIERING